LKKEKKKEKKRTHIKIYTIYFFDRLKQRNFWSNSVVCFDVKHYILIVRATCLIFFYLI